MVGHLASKIGVNLGRERKHLIPVLPWKERFWKGKEQLPLIWKISWHGAYFLDELS